MYYIHFCYLHCYNNKTCNLVYQCFIFTLLFALYNNKTYNLVYQCILFTLLFALYNNKTYN